MTKKAVSRIRKENRIMNERVVSVEEYNEVVGKFFANHVVINVETSPMVNDEYHKVYHCENGACLYEHNRIVVEEAEVEVKGIKVKVNIKLWETETWSTEFPSMYLYEKADN